MNNKNTTQENTTQNTIDEYDYSVSAYCETDCDDSGNNSGVYGDEDYSDDYGDSLNITDSNSGDYIPPEDNTGGGYGDSTDGEHISGGDGNNGYYDHPTDTNFPSPVPDTTTTTTTIPIPTPNTHPDDCMCETCFKKWAEENPEQYRYLFWLYWYYYCYGDIMIRPGEDGVPVTPDYIDNQSVYSVSAKRGTSGKYNHEHINLFTGQLTYKHNDIATSGALANASVTHYYASFKRADTTDHHCGKGWKLSIQQSVRESEYEYCNYVYVDAMGKEHYFVETESHGIIDTSGLNLTLTGTVGSECYITDRNGNKMTFDYAGRLTKVSDSNGNSVRYTYTGKLITKVTDSFGRELTLIYNDNNLLTEIRDPKLRSVKFNYNSDNELISITEPDGETSTYTYDSKNHLIEAVTPDGVKTVYTYETDSDRVIRTDKYATFNKTSHGTRTEADVPEEGEYTIIEYRGKRSTAVLDRSGIRHVYVFDDYGRCMHEYEDSLINGTQEKGQVTGTVVHSYAKQKRVFESSIVATDTENPSMLQNSTFENDSAFTTVPYGWDKTGGSINDMITTNACIDGTRSFMFAGEGYGYKYLSQTVNITNITDDEDAECVESTTSGNIIKYGDTLILSAWAKATPPESEEINSKLELRATAHYTSGKTEEFSAQYDPGFEGWQYAALPIRVNRKLKLQSVTVYLDCSENQNAVYFDNVRLVNSLANTVDYNDDLDENINIFGESVKIVQRITSHSGIYTTVTENDENYMPVRVTVTDMDKHSFVTVSKYDSKRNLIATQDYRGMVTLNDYTANGQISRTRSYHSEAFNTATSLTCPEERFIKEYTYDTNGEFMISESDSRSEDICTLYDYNRTDGSLNHTTDPNGVRTTYAYDNNTGALTMVSSTVNGQNVSVGYGYTARLLTAITHNSFDYLFEYDGFGRQTKISIGGNMFAKNTYTLTDTTTITTTYANNDSLTVTTDRHQAPIAKSYTKTERVIYVDNDDIYDDDCGSEYTSRVVDPGYTETLITNEYDELGKLTKAIDNCADIEYNYTYNELGNVVRETRNGETFKTVEYDRHNRLAETTVHTSDETLVYTPVYETRDSDGAIYADNAVKGMNLSGVFEQSVDKDKYGRPTKTSLKVGNNELLATEYEYYKSDNRLTGIVDTVTHKVEGYESGKFKYTYDVNGNITATSRVGECDTIEIVADYAYDSLNRLTRENNYALGKTYTYTYDTAGNILSKSTYDVTSGAVVTPTDVKEYTYSVSGWKDRLVAYGGQGISYDMVGNPWSYRGHTLEWSRIRLLTKWDDIEIDYNASGMRTRKGDTYYELDGDTIISETTCGDTIRYYYGNGGIVGFRHNGIKYYYEKNLQGDIVGIYDASGDKVGAYVYDAWGNCTITTNIGGIAMVNPFRYRGYYYDSDIGLYYLKNRYYDAAIGRFINADEVISKAGHNTRGYNLYSYCFNNSVAMMDTNGNWPRWITAAAAVVSTAVSVIAIAACAPNAAKNAATVAIVSATAYVIQSIHYDVRAEYNRNVPESYYDAMKKEGADNTISAACHQFTANDGENIKVCWPDGTEGIYNSSGNLVTDPRDMGTYNVFVPNDDFSAVMHGFFDVAPWIIFGNSDSDPGPIINYPLMWLKQLFG